MGGAPSLIYPVPSGYKTVTIFVDKSVLYGYAWQDTDSDFLNNVYPQDTQLTSTSPRYPYPTGETTIAFPASMIGKQLYVYMFKPEAFIKSRFTITLTPGARYVAAWLSTKEYSLTQTN